MIMETRKCRICSEEKPITHYQKNRSQQIINGKIYPALYRSECKVCRSAGGRADSSAAQKIMKKMKMKRPELGTPCDNCGKTTQKLVFDHCHETNVFRGWLCYQCNTSIGNLGDNIEGLERALNYLKRVYNVPVIV